MLFISQKTVYVEGFVCVHIRQSNLCYFTFISTCVVVSVIIVACSLFLSMCLFVLVNCLLLCVA